MADLMKRAEKLDSLRLKGIAEKLTLEEAQNIVNIWGIFLEHSGGVRMLFATDIPQSILPFPIEILQGALNKMEAYYYELGMQDRVKLLESTEAMLMQYEEDDEAMKATAKRYADKKFRDVFITGLKDYQMSQLQKGYLVDKKLWKLSESRIKELLE
ncbi:MAG: hypothetical protein A2629_00215 [Candidatus Levybacteria bacterium RIFCSPHIGHO2_01_FULL_41_15]|uniref:Uncharacterized protein n=1 Tax=Candidatus Roizmanbacteria bacterium RIFCSPHIGHO2_12_FULL_33_9 TaxID=1802045 RepID=A0A1F7HGN8_9BACT|nr:MAG: hypothetical protein A2629_00215 [Candidatus Levybacteria bacterium RIFCSPHIGHO2_01_FULL_41_15]OGK29942.1 MAG: hypothetical protein A3F29_04545 [Candidatus Roizmanbacteria bacterium RIFCSPHIGHO2_12_FULL_33_9]